MVSLATLTQHSLQEIFDTVVDGLRSQHFLQSGNDDGCAYRGDGGMKCAIGHLMTDAEYAELSAWARGATRAAPIPATDIEGWGLKALAGHGPLPPMEGHAELYDLLRSLQCAHDAGEDPDTLVDELIDIADQHGWADSIQRIAAP